MHLTLKPDVNRVKNGFSARIPSLRIAVHGHSPELAARNLERTVLLYLKPFERSGTLKQELEAAGLEVQGGEGELTIEATA